MKQQYAVVFERTPNNYSAYVPDLPGCVSTGESFEDAQRTIREAIAFHIEAMSERGELLTEPKMSLEGAEAHHNNVLTEYREDVSTQFDDMDPDLQAKFGMVEVEVETPLSARTG